MTVSVLWRDRNILTYVSGANADGHRAHSLTLLSRLLSVQLRRSPALYSSSTPDTRLAISMEQTHSSQVIRLYRLIEGNRESEEVVDIPHSLIKIILVTSQTRISPFRSIYSLLTTSKSSSASLTAFLLVGFPAKPKKNSDNP